MTKSLQSNDSRSTPRMSMPRHGMTPPVDLPSLDVNHWRVAIADIE